MFDSCPGRIDGLIAARGVLSAALASSFADVEARWPTLLGALAAVFGAFLRIPYIASNIQQVCCFLVVPIVQTTFIHTTNKGIFHVAGGDPNQRPPAVSVFLSRPNHPMEKRAGMV